MSLKATIPLDRLDAVIFDMDGVVTDTAALHQACWKRVFDGFLKEHSAASGQGFRPFSQDDYLRYVDGRLRYDGVGSFLASRGVSLERGMPSDSPGHQTVCAVGNLKDREFARTLREEGVHAFDTTVTLIKSLRARDMRTAIISSSRNARAVLAAAGVQELFDVTVDGIEAAELGLTGKPDPAIFWAAARRLGVEPARAAIVEDALAGVEAGRRGGFALVVGVDRTGHPGGLKEHGADVVVHDLAELRFSDEGGDCYQDSP